MRDLRRGFNKVGLALCATALASCVHLQDRETVVTPTGPTPERVAEAPPAPPPATAAAPARPLRPRTAVVVSGDVTEYNRIVAEIVRRGDHPVTVHTLSTQLGDAARVIAEIESEKAERIIAVGLPRRSRRATSRTHRPSSARSSTIETTTSFPRPRRA